MTTLHDKIMNISWQEDPYSPDRAERIAYKTGHRDARHAAAELAAKQDVLIEQLAATLEWAMTQGGLSYTRRLPKQNEAYCDAVDNARAVLKSYKESQA